MAKTSTDSIRTLCSKRITVFKLTADNPVRFENRVVRSVEENLASGRFERLVASSSPDQPLKLADYVDRVIDHANREEARLQALEDGEPAEWNRLRDFLIRRAITMIRRFRGGTNVLAEAFDFAQETCIVIFHKRYPNDVSFDAWATTILKNLVLAHYMRSPDVLNRPTPPDSLDEPRGINSESGSSLGELLASSSSLAPFEKVENQILLLDAIDQLRSGAQRRVIRESFLEGLDDAQIAKRLGKTKQAVYNLRQRALARLRKIMTEPVRKNSLRKPIK